MSEETLNREQNLGNLGNSSEYVEPTKIKEDELTKLQKSFSSIYTGSDLLRKEYEIAKEAKRFEMTVDEYRRLLQISTDKQIPFLSKLPTWTGFREKKLWDILQLLIVPLVLFVGGLLFQEQSKNRDTEAANEKARQESLQKYFDSIDPLYKKLGTDKSVQIIARARTLATVSELDGKRKGQLVRFLLEAGLIRGGDAAIKLEGADLSEINLSGADLNRVNLEGANLKKANFSKANLVGAKLSSETTSTDLSGANFSEANLSRTVFEKANLSEADFSNARLNATNLSEAKLVGTLFKGSSLLNTNMEGAELKSDRDLQVALRLCNITLPNKSKSKGRCPKGSLINQSIEVRTGPGNDYPLLFILPVGSFVEGDVYEDSSFVYRDGGEWVFIEEGWAKQRPEDTPKDTEPTEPPKDTEPTEPPKKSSKPVKK